MMFCEFSQFYKRPAFLNERETRDISQDLVCTVTSPQLPSYLIMKGIKKKRNLNNYSRLDFCNLGSVLAASMQDEISTQCYYIAYLMNVDKMGFKYCIKYSSCLKI